ncbi:heat stress transcription factor A-5-like [Dioscorea cayenensis subsp. rotundata]|uniref:Heat stress transcription factor A-5-like n=1 Tax=Dioscorea cayennensis subsp. rotundata TaxID=55577 RepID=A0AB40BYK3_DIOCR|nr:heat stress transcription factor A-5-like [Dioscorea cayenensis subsp. rotundata]
MKSQLDGLDQRLHDMEQRQEKMISFIQRAIQNPKFMETFVKIAVAGSMDFSVIHKKRRLPNGNSYYNDHSTATKNEDVGHAFLLLIKNLLFDHMPWMKGKLLDGLYKNGCNINVLSCSYNASVSSSSISMSGAEGCVTADSLNEDDLSCSSGKDALRSSSSS